VNVETVAGFVGGANVANVETLAGFARGADVANVEAITAFVDRLAVGCRAA